MLTLNSSPLDQAALNQFQAQGYTVAHGLLDLELDLKPLISEYEDKLNCLIDSWQAAGYITDPIGHYSFSEKVKYIVSRSTIDYTQHLDISLPQSGLTTDTPMHTGPALFNLLRSPRLLDAVEQLIGPEIYSNPVQHVRIKPPENILPVGKAVSSLLTQTPWHQDLGVIDEEADDSNILTVWIAITEATEENGCMVVMPNSHLEPLAQHCPSQEMGLAIPEQHIHASKNEPLALPMQPGDVLFMTRTTMHTSLRNQSDNIRWSFDLRYNPIGAKSGRPWFPGFVARSHAHPEYELHDAADWAQLWAEAHRKLLDQEAPTFNRWDPNAIGCA